jgi:preprotein translocase subunit SecA
MMVGKLFSKIVGSRNDRQLRRMDKIVTRVNAFETEIGGLDDAALKAKTDHFRARFVDGESLDDLLPEAFAVVREAGQRALGMRHFDVQLIGGLTLHEGHIAEMRTGEGKTLVATLPAYLNALSGHGVHIVTVNDYLASRDAQWMGQIFEFLGMTTGVVVPGQTPEEKRAAYGCDVVYATNNELGFDYLRDNMAFGVADKNQADLGFAIVDEVDSILIDEARTPLIISGPTDETSDLYIKINRLVPELVRQHEEDGPGDFTVDEKSRQVFLTEEGHGHAEDLLERDGLLASGESLYEATNIVLMHHLYAGLRAHSLYQCDVAYIVRDRQVVIVDEFTGRTLAGRRWSEGLHQAIEAKEGVPIQNENQTLASITFQNYFRLYSKLSGMTGTADTEAAEFQQIYGLEVLMIPTHREMVRDDRADLVYLTTDEKFEAIVEDIRDCHSRGQPTLVGTTSIETSELLSQVLTRENLPHEVLNAKQHEREAHIIQHAGRSGTVTIATNMAGRGTDIVLGGSLQADLDMLAEDDEAGREAVRVDWDKRHALTLGAGGLHIIGTERHESRRIDNQLRGRSGRQGDPGSSRFYLSLEDDLMRIFASDRVSNIMQKLGMEHGEAIEHRWVTKAIENAQRKVEGRNFDMRKQVLEYDDVANDQRKEIYSLRNELMSTDDVQGQVDAIREDVVNAMIDLHIPAQSLEEQWDVPALQAALEEMFAQPMPIQQWLDEDDSLHEETLRPKILDTIVQDYRDKENATGPEIMRHFEKAVMLQVLDQVWKEHLAAMDYLRQGIHLRGYAQKNPKQEYKREAFEMFSALTDRIKQEVIGVLSKIQVRAEEDVAAIEAQRRMGSAMNFIHQESPSMAQNPEELEALGVAAAARQPGAVFSPPPDGPSDDDAAAPYVRDARKVGRNEPCPCGSGKKFKQCHGRLA